VGKDELDGKTKYVTLTRRNSFIVQSGGPKKTVIRK